MQIITDIDKNLEIEKSVVTIGTFDGLHIGHTEIIDTLKSKAKELGLASVVITFYPHPRTIVATEFKLKLLTPLEEKKKLFEKFGVDYLFIVSFTKEFSKKSYKDFFDEILVNSVNAKHLVIGYDHKFGKDRDGDINKLVEYTKDNSIGITVVGPKEIEDETVSSTKIRNALLSGDLATANKMLGRYYFLDGIVVEGANRGRTLGFPTANLGLKEDNKLVPCNGVYLVNVKVQNSTHFGVANIGLRPTFNHVREPIVEVFILDFNDDIYGRNISVEFIKRIRDEKKFSSKEELEKNIKLDVENARKIIKDINK
jgi:riboflavin kinase / FMN adenylyltransferase